MSTFERDFNSAVEAVERDVFINLVCENPQLTLAELTRLGKGKFAGLLSTVSVGDLIEAGGTPVRGSIDLKIKASKVYNANGSVNVGVNGSNGSNGKHRTKPVNTRTPEGRKAYDAAVFAVVDQAERPIKAPEITSLVGGTALQVRKALARLIEDGKITWEGKARGMRYSPQ